MLNRGEMGSQWLGFIIALVIVTAIVLFGYTSYSSVSAKQCLFDQVGFEQQLRLDMDTILSSEGSVENKSYTVPCGVEKLYFVDYGSIDPDDQFTMSAFERLPLIQDAIEDRTGRNLFFVSKGRVDKSITVENISTEFPYFQCFLAIKGKIEMLIGEKDGVVMLEHADPKFNCGATTYTVEASEENTQEVFSAASPMDEDKEVTCDGEGTIIAGVSESDEIGQFLQEKTKCKNKELKFHQENVEVKRAFNFDDGTEVKLRFRVVQGQDIDDFIFMEYIPKACIENINDPDEGMPPGEKLRNKLKQDEEDGLNGEGGEFLTKDDPLLMWSFSKLGRQPKEGYYKLNKVLSGECPELMKGVSMSLKDKAGGG